MFEFDTKTLKTGNYSGIPLYVIHLLFLLFLTGLFYAKSFLAIGYVGLLIMSVPRLFEGRAFWKTPRNKPFIWLIYLYAFLMITQMWSGSGWDELKSIKGMIIFPWIVFAFRGHLDKYWGKYLVWITACLISASLLVIAIRYGPAWLDQFFRGDLSAEVDPDKFGWFYPFGDRLQFSYLAIGILFIAIYYFRSIHKAWFFLAALPIGIALLGLGARGAQLAGLMAVMIWFTAVMAPVISKALRIPVISAGLLTAISGLVLIIIFGLLAYQNLEPVKQRYNQVKWEVETFRDKTYKPEQLYHYTTIRRYISWKYHWELIREKPFLGWGVGNYRKPMQQLYDRDEIILPVHSSQQYLYFMVTGGILALLIFLASQISWIYHMIKRGYGPGFVLAFMGFFTVIFLFDTPLIYSIGNGTYFFLISILLTLKPINN